MKTTHQQIFEAYSHSLIGLPYECFDCYDVVKMFYHKVFSISLPLFVYKDSLNPEKMNDVIMTNRKDFKKVNEPQFGDIILLKINSLPAHLGVYLDKENFLHTTEVTGSIIDKLSMWKGRIEGFYNYG